MSTAAIDNLGTRSFLFHQPINPVLAATLVEATQIVSDLAAAADAAALQPGVLDQAEQALLFLGTQRSWLGPPSVIAAGVDGHHMAQQANRIRRFVGQGIRTSPRFLGKVRRGLF